MTAPAIIADAKAVRLEDELARRSHQLKHQGRELIGPCPVCGGTDRFGVNITKQIWNCRGCSKGGDVIALVQHMDGADFGEAVRLLAGDNRRSEKAKDQVGIARLKPDQGGPSTLESPRPGAREKGRNPTFNTGANDRQRHIARSIWSRRQPITRDTPVWTYLKRRGLDPGKLPRTLGYLPPADKYPDHCMVAAFGLAVEFEPGVLAVPPDIVRAVHLTKLTVDGNKIADNAKIMIGSPKAAPIVLAPPNDLLGLAITEGIEDGLSVAQATGLGVWAAGAAGIMPAIADVIPSYVECVTIYLHNDGGRKFAVQLAELLTARGTEVLIEGNKP